MSALTLELPTEVYRRLREEAARLGKQPQMVAEEWLTEWLTHPSAMPSSNRERTRRVLRDAGLLTELGPDLRYLADSTVRPEDVEAALDRTGGKTLSEIVLEQRGPKG